MAGSASPAASAFRGQWFRSGAWPPGRFFIAALSVPSCWNLPIQARAGSSSSSPTPTVADSTGRWIRAPRPFRAPSQPDLRLRSACIRPDGRVLPCPGKASRELRQTSTRATTSGEHMDVRAVIPSWGAPSSRAYRKPTIRRGATVLSAWLATTVLVGCSVPLGARTGIPASASVPKHPAWMSTQQLAAWNNDGFVVFNNEWNTAQAGPQMIWANSFHSWGVESKQPLSTSVKTYPSVQRNYNDVLLAKFTELSSSFNQSMPAFTDFDADSAYDIWLNDYKIEIMIWVDNHGQTPAGNVITTARLQDQRFTVWQAGPTMFSFVLANGREPSGHVNILTFLRWLVQRRYLSDHAALRQVDFGWEIASTEGIPMAFVMKDYSLISNPQS
jgi:hypothetical protein